MSAARRATGGLMERTAQASAVLASAREEARLMTRQAVELMQRRLAEALAGEVLRGLVDLNPGGERWLGARVRGGERHGVDSFLSPDGKPALCIDKRGALVMARVVEGRGVKAYAVEADDLLIEDLEPYARAIVIVLSRHLDSSSRASASYEWQRRLAMALHAALVG